MLSESFGVTGFLALYSFVIATVGGVPLGILAAVRRRRATDRVVVGTTVFVSSTPVFVSGVALLYLFAVVFKVFPAYGAGSGFTDRLWHLTLPAITLGAAIMALVVKLTRTAVSNTLEQDYVAFARARGASRSRVLVRYALRNALVPIVTAGGLVLTAVLGGSVLTEVTFSLPGLGEMLISGVNNKDYPVVQGVALVIAASVVLVNLIVDVLYTVIDPRIAFGRSGS
jgi:peptide/nickel transport system permease protein